MLSILQCFVVIYQEIFGGNMNTIELEDYMMKDEFISKMFGGVLPKDLLPGNNHIFHPNNHLPGQSQNNNCDSGPERKC